MSRPYFLRFLCSLLFLLPALRAVAQQSDPAARAAAIAPYLDEQTLAVGHVDLARLDPAAALALALENVPAADSKSRQHLQSLEKQARTMLKAIQANGISEIYVVASLSDLPQSLPFVVAPLKAGASAEQAVELLKDLAPHGAAEMIRGCAVAGSAETLARLKELKPTPRPELQRAFERAGDSTAQLVFCPNDDNRRVLREMLPRLSDELGGGSGKMLADGMQWGAIWADGPPNLKLTLAIQSKDADAAAALRGTIASALKKMAQQETLRKEFPEIKDLAVLLTPKVNGDQLQLQLTERSAGPQAIKLLMRPLQAMQTARDRAQSANNLKQLGYVLHMVHDATGTFPPQAIRSPDGKPLLSWRVAILPYLNEQALYDEFRQNEAWDSAHNRKLIARMPPTLATPSLGSEARAEGKTCYLAPLSKAPPAVAVPLKIDPKAPIVNGKNEMIFDLPQGTQFAHVLDGLSNTILLLEAPASSAVVWTRPDDLVIDAQDPWKTLGGQSAGGFAALLADGSVRRIGPAAPRQQLLNLLQMNDGNPVGEF